VYLDDSHYPTLSFNIVAVILSLILISHRRLKPPPGCNAKEGRRRRRIGAIRANSKFLILVLVQEILRFKRISIWTNIK